MRFSAICVFAVACGIAVADPCCNECTGSDRKYYSVDMKRGHCGETCIYPGRFALFKAFESNLTRADGSTGYKSCADLGWPKYQETVTHGDPLKLLTVTLDLYGHDDALKITAPMASIVETAQATPQLSSLVGALVSADLVGALSGPGPFTVFAPTNDAFAAISSVTAGLTIEQLRRVLEYHVISGVAAKSTDLTNLEVLLPLVSGKSLHVNLDNPGEVRIVGETNYVTVTIADVLCTNGVVHIVDAVLIPILSEKSLVMAAPADPCCNECTGSDRKYYSVDMKRGHCGEACIYPGRFALFKVFESNLTRADGSTGFKSCADLGWPKYQETVTHGDPLKLLTVTLDLYGHDEVSAVI